MLVLSLIRLGNQTAVQWTGTPCGPSGMRLPVTVLTVCSGLDKGLAYLSIDFLTKWNQVHSYIFYFSSCVFFCPVSGNEKEIEYYLNAN